MASPGLALRQGAAAPEAESGCGILTGHPGLQEDHLSGVTQSIMESDPDPPYNCLWGLQHGLGWGKGFGFK